MDRQRRISLVTLMGLPASGKTTLCQELVKFVSTLDASGPHEIPSITLLQFDSIVPIQIQSQFSQYPNLAKTLRINFLKLLNHFVEVFQQLKPQEELAQLNETELLDIEADQILTKSTFSSSFFSQFPPTILEQTELILLIDDNNYYKSMRNDFYQIAKTNNLGFCVLHPTATLASCQQRNLEREDKFRLPKHVIEEMNNRIEEPNPLQNAADALCLRISDVLDPSTHKLIYDTLKTTLQNPIQDPSPKTRKELEKNRRNCAENEVHQADLIIRKWIHTELALASFGSTRDEMKAKGQQLQATKIAVLEGLRSGDMQVLSCPGDEFEFRKEVLALARMVILPQSITSS